MTAKLSEQFVATVSSNERTRKEKSIQWESLANWTWYVYTSGFFNLWKYGEGMQCVLFMIIRFIVRETWFTKIDNLEMDTTKKLLCFVEIQLALHKRLPQCNERLRGLRVIWFFLKLFIEFKDKHDSKLI